jgi:hypothetical protein
VDRRVQQVALHDLLEQRQRTRCRGQRHRPGVTQVLGAEAQQPAAAQDRGRERVAPGDQFIDGEGLAALQPLQQAEVGRGEQADVVGVLAVAAARSSVRPPADARELLRRRAVLAREPLPYRWPPP